MSDEPIEPLDYLGGVTVVDIGDYRVSRGMTRRPASSCKHLQMRYDSKERRVWCSDCEKDVDPFDALLFIVEGYDGALKRLQRREKELQEAERFQARSRATKALDEVWRRKNMVPACPSCGEGLLPEDFKDGRFSCLGREYAEAKRRRRLDGAK